MIDNHKMNLVITVIRDGLTGGLEKSEILKRVCEWEDVKVESDTIPEWLSMLYTETCRLHRIHKDVTQLRTAACLQANKPHAQQRDLDYAKGVCDRADNNGYNPPPGEEYNSYYANGWGDMDQRMH